MAKIDARQGSIKEITLNDSLGYWIESFLFDRKSQNMAPGTLYFYQVKLKTFLKYCDGQQITRISQIDANALRRFIMWLEETGHNAGGRHALYRAIKTFMLWYENEVELDNWKNPIRKIKAPHVPTEPLDPIPTEDIQAMEKTCDHTFLGQRDKAILLTLLDTGARAAELLNINLEDIDLKTGVVLIRQGKGRKPRTVFLGAKTKRSIRAYLKYRNDSCLALWVSNDNLNRLTYSGLRWIIIRRAKLANVKHYGLHAFRRQFALTMLRNGVDVVTLSRLIGHTSLAVMKKYLKQITTDLQDAHIKGSPVDHGDF